MSAKAIAIFGTASDVGKSVIAAGLCRIFRRAGIRVAPFKAQNMSLNSYVTPDGGEIGWAQAAQARACGIEPSVEMNPVLLKPVSETGAQVIVQGKVFANLQARQYYRASARLCKSIRESYRRLARDFALVVIEGAGGAAEINLRDCDLANFRMAELADAGVLLVADIERGGVFASVTGTLALLRPRERERVKGLIVNKFRGDKGFFAGGVELLKRRTGIPVLGVIPYYDQMALPEEDSVALQRKRKAARPFTTRTINIAVVSLPHMANYTDFAALENETDVALRYAAGAEEISGADAIILPGTKNTLGDLAWLRRSGCAEAVRAHAGGGGSVIGICGGYQMLGETIGDPRGVDGGKRWRGKALGLLPLATEMVEPKITRRVVARPLMSGAAAALEAYEIHMGRTEVGREVAPAFQIVQRNGVNCGDGDGAVIDGGRVWGSYLHGIFADDDFRARWLASLARAKGLRRKNGRAKARDPYDDWAAHLSRHLDVERICELLAIKSPNGLR